jgi:hypothetical protein
MTAKDTEIFLDEETARRRDEVIRRMANTPPQPKATTPHRPTKKKLARVAGPVRRAPAVKLPVLH